ncbi:alanine--tRNA ligase, mitochondrial isoform X1 [Euwallacea fornicatus]|uniref:alanine--tRNA ligase, mitochondrial isoform X1 n=1 Tax=Euwallacea fornicatus TaxID=995702 RepID=UPI00338E9969
MAFQLYPKFLYTSRKMPCCIWVRKISKYIHKDISAQTIRRHFFDYFIKSHDHTFVRSSPVVPYCDPTVPFVNAGMNQFKGIFLGTQTPHFTRVANSQKCIRVGGKHNDLNVVGKDGYHHTFFEMMGNWSFGDYFKEEACRMAWELLTQIYKIPPSKLYITYFSGDKLGLDSDIETKDIWRRIGVSEDRILPFSVKENFWEMGVTGPCGPCTEIHFDHSGSINRSEFVNKNLHDLTEIWNLVFIQYNRLPDGSLSPLPKKHVDTGLGLERLCCALQGKQCTYDTDLLDYLIIAIQKNCSSIQKYSAKFGEQDRNGINTSYRILADHTRMITACLADGVIPEQNQKLRRILRKCFILCENVFGKERGLVKELTNYVVENLGDVYPEMEKNISQIHQIIDYEEDVYSAIRTEAKKDWRKFSVKKELPNIDNFELTPSFIKAFKELYTAKPSEIDEQWAHKLYDRHGFDAEGIEQLSKALNIKFNPETFEKKMAEVKLKSKTSRQITIDKLITALVETDLKKTDDSQKYSYTKTNNSEYKFPETQCRIVQIVDKDQFVSELKNRKSCGLILDRTNLYCEAGGQESDKGKILFDNNAIFHVESLSSVNDLIIHRGYLEGNSIKVGSEGKIIIDKNHRLSNMRNHTSAHLMNAAIKKIKLVTCQNSSKVTHKYVKLDVSVFDAKLDLEDVIKIEQIISNIIKDKVDVKVNVTDSQGLYSYEDVTLIPGEVYPDNEIRIVEINDGEVRNFVSREPCCGTHVQNTGDLEDFCIIHLKSLGRSTSSIHGVTGERAKLARENAKDLFADVAKFKDSIKEHFDTLEMLDIGVMSFKERFKFEVTDDAILPYVFKTQILNELNAFSKKIKDQSNEDLRNFVDLEMHDAMKNKIQVTKSNKKYMIHYLKSSVMFESVPLQRATSVCPNIPVIVIAYSDGMVKARCCVPKDVQTESFDAKKWLNETVALVFKAETTSQKLQNGVLVCNMIAKRIHVQEWQHLLAESVRNATNYIEEEL